jgi:hypothetical protein
MEKLSTNFAAHLRQLIVSLVGAIMTPPDGA